MRSADAMCSDVAQRFAFGDADLHARFQIAAREIFHRQVFTAVVHAVVVELHDRGVTNSRHRFVFASEQMTTARFIGTDWR